MTDETSSLVEQGLIPRAVVPRNTVPNKPPAVAHDRITVVETVSFTSLSGTRTAPVDSRYWRRLALTGDRPYQRSFLVTEEPVPLDVGWAREWPGIGLLHVSNDVGKRRQVIPTPAELAEDAKKVVELGDWLILPGESMRGLPKDYSQLKIRCQFGSARVTVTVYPA